MGGKKFYGDHKDCIEEIHSNELRGGLYVVDTSNQLHRIMIGIKNKKRSKTSKIHDYIDIKLVDPKGNMTIDELIKFEDQVSHIIALCSFEETCISKCIFTIKVLDGKAPALKRKKLDERQKNRENANRECSKIEDKTSDSYIKLHKKSVGLKNEHYQEVNELLDAMGLIKVQSPGEADSQCAAIAACLPNVKAVIAEDSDVLIFGGPEVIKSFNRKNNILNKVRLQDILESLKTRANKILETNGLQLIDEFKSEHFVDYRILLGTDYNDGIGGIEVEKIFELFVLSNFDVPILVQKLKEINVDELVTKGRSTINIPVLFEEEWTDAKKYYLDADVIDPMTIKLLLKPPDFYKMVEILHYKNKFNINFVEELYNGLYQMYYLYYNIPFGSHWYNSFRSYQIKFHNNKFKNNKKNMQKICEEGYNNHIKKICTNNKKKCKEHNVPLLTCQQNQYELLSF